MTSIKKRPTKGPNKKKKKKSYNLSEPPYKKV